jgi:hypothetical protein
VENRIFHLNRRGKKMNKKIVSIVLITLVITSSIAIINRYNTSVKATGEVPHGEHENAMGLDLGGYIPK